MRQHIGRTAPPRAGGVLRRALPSTQAIFGTICSAVVVRLVDSLWGCLINTKLPWLRPAIDTIQMRSSFDVCADLAHTAVPGYRFVPPAYNSGDSSGTHRLISDLVVGRAIAMLFDWLFGKMDGLLTQGWSGSRKAARSQKLDDTTAVENGTAIQVNVSIAQGGTSQQHTVIHQGFGRGSQSAKQRNGAGAAGELPGHSTHDLHSP